MEFLNKNKTLSLVILLIISILCLFPIIQNLSTHIPGEPNKTGDAPIFLFNIFDLKTHLNESSNIVFSKNLNYPLENNLLFNSHSVLLSLFTLMFENPARGINIFIFLMYLLSALGAFLLFKDNGLNNFFSLLGALLWSFSTYKLMQLQTHISLICTAPIPFYLWQFPKIFKENKILNFNYKKIIICLAIGIISVSLEYYQSFFLIYYSVFYIIYLLIKDRIKLNNRKLLWLIPILLFLSKIGVDTLNSLGLNNMGALWWSPDLFALFFPINNPLILENFDELLKRIPSYKENYVFLGATLWIAIIILIFYSFKRKLIGTNAYLIIFSILFFLFTFPEISFLGNRIANSPGAFIYYIHGLNHVRVPGRYFLMFSIFFIPQILLYLQNIDNKKINFTLFLAGCLSVFPWFGINQLEIKSYQKELEQIAENKEIKLILPFPTGIKDGSKEYGNFLTSHFIAQYYHKKAIIGGYLSRIPDEHFDYYNNHKSMHKLLELSKGNSINLDQKDIENLLRDFPFDYILLDKDYAKSKQWEIFKSGFSADQMDSLMAGDHYIHYKINHINH